MKSIGVIGGGLLGLNVARRLSDEGFIVTILEADSEIGGLLRHYTQNNYKWDEFYHVILPDDKYTLEMISDLGLKKDLYWAKTKTGFFIDGGHYSMSNLIDFLKFPTLGLFDKFRLGLTIIIATYLSNFKRLEKIPVNTWLQFWSGNNIFLKIWLPLLKAKLGEDYQSASASFIVATIRRLYGSRKGVSKNEVFGYLNGGYSHILEAIKREIEVRNINLITDFNVEGILELKGKQLAVSSGNGNQFCFDYVISTIPSFLTAGICSDALIKEKKQLKNVKYLGVICVSLLLKNQVSQFYVTNITDDKINLTGIIEMTALTGNSFYGGNSLIYLPKYLRPDDPMFENTDEEIKERFVASLKIISPSLANENIIDWHVAKARFVITFPQMGYSKKLPLFKTSISNLFIINSSFIVDGILNVNETLKVSENYLPQIVSFINSNE